MKTISEKVPISSKIEIMNYFSSKMEEIKEGSYVPTYEFVKGLPEFSEISVNTFNIARRQWYSEHFHTTFLRHSKRLEIIKARDITQEEYDKSLKQSGICFLIAGLILFIPFFPLGIVLLGVGISSLQKRSEKERTVSEKKTRKSWGIVLSIVGLALIIIDIIWVPLSLWGWPNPTFFFLILIGIVLIAFGINLIWKYSEKKIVPEA